MRLYVIISLAFFVWIEMSPSSQTNHQNRAEKVYHTFLKNYNEFEQSLSNFNEAITINKTSSIPKIQCDPWTRLEICIAYIHN